MTSLNQILYVGNDMRIKLLGLRDLDSQALIDNATVTATLKNAAGENVVGQAWPLSLTPAGSGGNYTGQLEDTLELVHNQVYTLEVEADSGGGVIANWTMPVVAKMRDFI